MMEASGLKYQVFLITTQEAVDRQERCLKFLKSIPALEKVTVLNSERDFEDTRRGCFNAHKRWAQEVANNENIDVAVVFEDDIHSNLSPDEINTKFLECMNFIRVRQPKPDVFFLGHFPWGRLSRTTAGGSFVKSNYSAQTHAMIIPREYAVEISTWEYTPGTHVDMKLASECRGQFAIYPQIIFQNDTVTYHSRWVDKFLTCVRDVIGPVRLCKWLEWFWIRV